MTRRFLDSVGLEGVAVGYVWKKMLVWVPISAAIAYGAVWVLWFLFRALIFMVQN